MTEHDQPTRSRPADKLVLIVDDDENIRNLLTILLSEQGFQVETAVDGDEASAKIEARPPHLIVTDLMMPRHGGWDFLRKLPAAGLGRVRVFVITGSGINDSTIDMIRRESGVLEFFTKPIKVPAFLAAVHRHLNTAPPAR